MNLHHIIKSFISFIIGLTLLAISSCKSDDNLPQSPNLNSDILSDALDQKYFKQLKSIGDTYAQNTIWENYNFKAISQYIIRKEANQTAKGFIINPSTVTSTMKKIDDHLTDGLVIYRYDEQISDAIKVLNNGNSLFDFNYNIGGNNYYLQIYSTDDVENGEALAVNIHENFHIYQFGWNEKPTSIQDFDNFPVTQALLPLQILTLEIFRNVKEIKDTTKLRSLLKQYVAIRTEEMRRDPSSNRLITNHANYQELIEGTAKYIEVTAITNSDLFPDNEFNYVNTQTLDRQNVTSKSQVRELVGQLAFYDTGSAVLYVLKSLGMDIENLENNQYPYDMAKDFLKLTDQQLNEALIEATSHAKWELIQVKASEWSQLK